MASQEEIVREKIKRGLELRPVEQRLANELGILGETPTRTPAPSQRVAPAPPARPGGLEALTPMMDPMSGFPISRTQEEAEATTSAAGDIGRFSIAQALGIGLPVAGTIGGTALGGPVGGFLGETAGSFAARRANVALGLEEPGLAGDVAALAVPGVARAATSVARGIARRLPGVGTAMQDIGVTQARQLPEGLIPSPASDTLYAQVAKINQPVTLSESKQAVSSILAEQAKLPRDLQSPIVATAEGLDALANAPGGTDFQTLWLAQKEIRSRMRATTDGQLRHYLGQLDNAIWRDLDQMAAAGQPGAGLLRAANKAYRKERAVDDLRAMIEGSITEAVQGQGTGRLNAGAMLKRFDTKVRDDDLFAGAFSADEQKAIRGLLKDLSTIPVMGPVAGQMFGSGMGLGMGGLTFAGSGGDPVMTGMATALPWLLSGALATAPGRTVVRGLMRSERLLTPEGAAALRAVTRSTGQRASEHALSEGPSIRRGPLTPQESPQ